MLTIVKCEQHCFLRLFNNVSTLEAGRGELHHAWRILAGVQEMYAYWGGQIWMLEKYLAFLKAWL